ncbi:cellulase family glycosylhydrolase [Parapedobacter koreensis]|uniref:Carbohydrate binding module (Family 6) n=1 Tax=Parapedobacter koreensis TaxID=332977 RepID=A0A1H7GFK4_9SPHI|nr:cellulase family glycosylhydrolase [Parapedobacter koreensis]SEK37076.1 Carbohydrate binding module (family 6) [Parapedobacter koreensis]
MNTHIKPPASPIIFPALAALFCCILFMSCETPKKNFLHAQGHHIVNGHGDTIILRGMGLGGWMLQEGYMFRISFLGRQYRIRESIEDIIGKEETDRFYEQWLANHTRRVDIDSMAAWGFNSIRLPMHYNLYTLPVEDEPVDGENTWLEKGFAMTDSLLAWCKANRMYLILDLHAAPGGQGNDLNISDRNPDKPSFWESEANREKTIALWRKLADRYVDEEWIGGYDVLNETNWGFEDSTDFRGTAEQTNVPLRQFLVDVTRAIREVDTNHIIFLEGNGFANNYNGIFPKWDDNLVLSFHKYGNPNTEASIQRFLDLREEHDIPLWLGESGENSNTWFTEAIELCERNGIGWAWWQNKKMGINQPLEIKQPEGYASLLDYWSGRGSKPSHEDAQRILNEWLENIKLENNIFHPDVVDAMFRQVYTHGAIPFKENAVREGSVLHAIDFDLGRQRVAYYDTDTASYHYTPGMDTQGNRGRSYRNDGVDIQPDSSGYHIFHIEDGEWLQYTLNVMEEGIMYLGLAVNSETGGGRIRVAVNGETLPEPIAVPATGSGQTWTTLVVQIPAFTMGKHMVRITAETGGFNFKSLTFGQP